MILEETIRNMKNINNFLQSKKVLVISPHPDDESFGCGGVICKHVKDGDTVFSIFISSGEKGNPSHISEKQTIIMREKEAHTASKILGIKKIEFFREPDGNIQYSERLFKKLAARLRTIKPDIVYLPHLNEMNQDHSMVAKIVMKVLAKIYENEIMKPDAFMFEVWTPIEKFNYIVDISPFISKKMKAIRAHKSQCDLISYDAASLGLSRYRGEMHSWPGGKYAEVFIKFII